MLIYLLKMFCISLILTLVLELLTAVLLRVELSKKNVYLIGLVNLLTNPPAVLLVWLGRQFFGGNFSLLLEIFVEIVVILTESSIYRKFVREENWNMKHPILLAVIANIISWGVGFVLQLL